MPGWMSIEEIQCLQVAASRSKVIVELGSWCGKSLAAIAEAAQKPVSPEAIAVVLRYPSDHPEGTCIVVGTTAAGPMETYEKEATLGRVLECLKEGDPLQVTLKRPKPNLIVHPGGDEEPPPGDSEEEAPAADPGKEPPVADPREEAPPRDPGEEAPPKDPD